VNDEVPRRIGGWLTAESIANACSIQPGKSVPMLTSECATIRPESVGPERLFYVLGTMCASQRDRDCSFCGMSLRSDLEINRSHGPLFEAGRQ